MIGVAVVYLLLFANLSWLKLDPSRLETLSPTYDTTTSVAAQTTIDALLMFGLELAVIAIALLWASRNPFEHRVLVWLVIALEAIRGIVDDPYLIFLREYPVDEVYYGFIVTEYLAYRNATTASETTGDGERPR